VVYIKRIEINGFKSFGKHTIINLDKGLICITGPNGSGKSNILDAITFALGENSSRVLRVDRLHSLIHDNGDSKAKKVRVSIAFDNSDRGIPIDSDTVSIAREMSMDSNESEYYLNGKHVSRSTLTNMLEASLVSANRLNIVPQGMVMRIAELNREERRRIIEDILGLSYFDEKKEEAKKQLDEADRRLEVALARIGEIRKRIDELEHERNDQLRFEFLEHEIARLKSVKLTNMLKNISLKISMLKDKVKEREQEIVKVSKELELVRGKISAVESEKNAFMKEVDNVSRTKAEISKKVSSLVFKAEQLRAMIDTNKSRIPILGNTISKIIKERDALKAKLATIDKDIAILNNRLAELEDKKSIINKQLTNINSKLEELTSKNNALNADINKMNEKITTLKDTYSSIELQIASINERLKILDSNREELEKKKDRLKNDINALEDLIAKLKDSRVNIMQELENVRSEYARVKEKRDRLNKQLDDALLLFNRAKEITTRYKTIIETAMHGEDNTIASLLSNAKQFNILGLVQDLISWDKMYNRAILASASNWLNAVVVKDVKSMLSILEYIKVNRFSRVTIIPLEIIEYFSHDNNSNSNKLKVRARRVAELIDCKYKGLKEFIFNDTLLVKDTEEAVRLAEDGYRVVTLNGELFEPKLNALIVDLSGRVSSVFKLLLNSRSVNDLSDALELLKQVIDKKRTNVKEMDDLLSSLDYRKVSLEQELIKLDLNHEHALSSLNKSKELLEDISVKIDKLEKDRVNLKESIESLTLKRSDVEKDIAILVEELRSFNMQSKLLLNAIDDVTREKNGVVNRLDAIEKDLRDVLTQISSKSAQRESILKRIDDMRREIEQVKQQARESMKIVKECKERLVLLEDELKAARDKEQEIINASIGYIDRLNAYDNDLKRLRDEERVLSKQLSMLERDLALSNKELNDLMLEEQRVKREIAVLGSDTIAVDEHNNDNYNINNEALLDELIKERDELKNYVNQLANKSYIQLIEGYRGLSEKKNQLEEERNAIVRFIEQIESEKRQLFLDAFTSIDKEVRSMFATMTDNMGSAWLEIEKPDDIFSSGIVFMLQFPNKPARESNSLSGGEKTIAAITFLLALQSLKPAPFYLFDEIDAHLDSINTERLKKIVKDRAKMSQIIMVTLKDTLVANADMVYGVYAKDGISHVVRYKIPVSVST
jgi:chromosome segregation protein